MSSACPYCGDPGGVASPVGHAGATPAAGEGSLCLYCGGLAMFTGEGLNVRRPSPAELAEIEAREAPNLAEARVIIAEFHRRTGGRRRRHERPRGVWN